ncbi:MAG: HAMP domain-containing histidine kinase [Clostridiales bacterium]|nr:HAMP domain-containing histidine kinase [Clostridiales bacterium]
MRKVKNYLKSMRFRIFILILIFGMVPIVVLNLACPDMQTEATNTVLAVIIVAAALFASAHMTRPLKRLIQSISDVRGGYEDDFEPVNTYSETESISAACGEMLGRLAAQDERQMEFVSNVSHELKTPLTSMKVLADSIMGQEDVQVEIYREFMEDIGEEMGRENAIIDDLLAMVRMNRPDSNMNMVQTDLVGVMDLLKKRLTPIAEAAGVNLTFNIVRPVTTRTDWLKLALAFSNLIENAIKYDHPGGWVRVTLDADLDNFHVKVADNGVGIPQGEQEQIFERFYRVDKSHSQSISGTGLGLSLARDAVTLHHGTITVTSKPGMGSEFVVSIPLTDDRIA